MATGSGLRIGDADREAAAARLREHFAHGRLTLEEFQHRLDAVFAAKTDGDLAKITSDLPFTASSVPPWSTSRPASGPNYGWTAVPAGTNGTSSRPNQESGQGWGSRSRPFSVLSIALLVIALVLIIGTFRPFGLLGGLLPRPMLLLAAALLFLVRMIRRAIGGGGRIRPRRRR